MGSYYQLCRIVVFAVIAVMGQSLSIDEIARRQSQLTMDTFQFFQEQIEVQVYALEDRILELEDRVTDIETRGSPIVDGVTGNKRLSQPDEPEGAGGRNTGQQETDNPMTEKPRKTAKPTVKATTERMVQATTTPPRPQYDRTCAEIYNNGYIYSAEYTIDPDGEGLITPFTVYCDMASGEGVTKVGHSDEQENIPVSGYENPGSFHLQPIYANGASMEQLGALADASKSCRQFVKYACKNSGLMEIELDSGLTYAWWVDRNGQKRVNFAGAPTDSQKCACFYGGSNGDVNECFMGSQTCNCDHKKAKNQVDEGEFTDKDLLPVMSINLGDTGNKKERGAITIGKFICEG